MADRLILAQAVAAAAALLLSAGSTAQALTDPTQPPLELIRAAVVDPVTGAKTAAARRPRVESILLSSARKGAIINGQYVPLGGAYGKATLVSISATEVTLKTDQKLEVIKLYPPMEKPSVAPGAEEKPEKMVKRP
jgi:hypothetical protein